MVIGLANIIFLFAVVIVGYQAIWVASANRIESLKYE